MFLIYAIGLHSIIMIFQFFDPEFKDLIYSYTTSGVFNGTFEYNFRPGGISGATGGSVLSVFHSLGLIFTLFIYNK